jgi:hypothetical protein
LYFDSRDLAAISLSAALWAVINWLVAPIFWQITHLPILCDMVGVSLFIITLWWTRKPGAVSFMGMIATLLTLILRPGATQFLGFTGASMVFDASTWLLGYSKRLELGLFSVVGLVSLSFLSTLVAGFIIGNLFLNPMFLSNVFGGIIVFAALHGVGGIIGGTLGIIIVKGLEARKIIPR